MRTERLLSLKLDHVEMGFMRARVKSEDRGFNDWSLHVVSPSEPDTFVHHLTAGTPVQLVMTTRGGERMSGEAYVANVSEGREAATVVDLTGVGALRIG